jgi:hypothetical protein
MNPIPKITPASAAAQLSMADNSPIGPIAQKAEHFRTDYTAFRKRGNTNARCLCPTIHWSYWETRLILQFLCSAQSQPALHAF